VRIPAHFCGNYAIKPTSKRISVQGFRGSIPGQEAVSSAAGVIGNSVDDLILVLKVLWVPAIWDRDHETIPIPIDQKECHNDRPLRIGYYEMDGFVSASPACIRAVRQTVQTLEQAGHTLIPFKVPRVLEAIRLYYSLLACDGGKTMSQQLKGEIFEDFTKTNLAFLRFPMYARLISFFAKYVARDEKLAAVVSSIKSSTVAELWKLQADRKKYRQEFYQTWQNEKFDVLLCPAHALPAPVHYSTKAISYSASYTFIYNLLDYPAGVCPITTVQSTDVYSSPPESILDKNIRRAYDPVTQSGLPVGVQVIGLPLHDETVIRAMKIIENLIPFKAKPTFIQT